MEKTLSDKLGLVHSDTRHIDENISLKTFLCQKKRGSSPLPVFDILTLDRILRSQETHAICVDWVLLKTKESNKCVILCLTRPRSLSGTSIHSLMEMPLCHAANSNSITPCNSIARALTESLSGQGITTKVVVHAQAITEEDVFTYSSLQLSIPTDMTCFTIDGKKWVQALRQTLGEIKLQPSVIEIAESPNHKSALNSTWSEILLFIQMSRQKKSSLTPKEQMPQSLKEDKTLKSDNVCSETMQNSLCHQQRTGTNQEAPHPTRPKNGSTGWRPWVQGIAVGLLFGSMPLWHIFSEFH